MISTSNPVEARQLESRMREIRQYGSEGGAARKGRPYPYQGCGPGRFWTTAGAAMIVALAGKLDGRNGVA